MSMTEHFLMLTCFINKCVINKLWHVYVIIIILFSFVYLKECNLFIASIRFDRLARRSLKLDSFIQCCVMLRGLTDAFRARDTTQNGNITINYEDFMCMVLLNKP